MLSKSTKPCPKCGVRIAKDGGCMFMMCSSCRTPFCWQCGLGDHHVWECNRPPKDGWNTTTSASKDADERYIFYFERYHNHRDSLEYALKQRASTDLSAASHAVRDVLSA